MLWLCLVVMAAGSCHRAHWEALYSDALQKTHRLEYSAALKMADEGLLNTIDSPVLNYRYRALKAQLIALEHPQEALQLLDTPPPPQSAPGEFDVERKTDQALAYGASSDFRGAERCLEEASAAVSRRPEKLAEVTFAKGVLARLQKDNRAEEKYLREAAAQARDLKQPWLETQALFNLAILEINHERYDEAIGDLSTPVEESRAAGAARVEELSLGDLGWSYYQIGDFDRAISSLKEASKIGLTDKQDLWQIDLGDVYLSQGNYEDAEKSFFSAESLASSVHNTERIILAFHNLAELELQRNNTDKAEEYNRKALAQDNCSFKVYLQELCSLSTAEIARNRKELSKAETLLQGIAKKADDPSLLWSAQSDLAAVYVAEGKPKAAEREFQAAIHTVDLARDPILQEERRMSILDAWPFYDDYIQFLFRQGRTRKALQIAEFSRARTLTEGLGIATFQSASELSVQQIQGSLKSPDQIVLAYWLAEKESYLWAITSSKIVPFVLPGQEEINKLIHAYTDELQNHKGIDDSLEGQKLYDLLVRPAERLVRKKGRVIIIPSRGLYRLNFETLVVPGTRPHYWIDDVSVEISGSMALLAAGTRGRSPASTKLLLVGAPLQVSDEFPALKHADEEIQKVAAHFPENQERIIVHNDATPDAYKSLDLSPFRFIHFVTHGTASETSPLDSAIILSPQADKSFKLYARDVMTTHLNAEVVTISACYGVGTRMYSGEGLVGLAWAFLRGGAHKVVAGLWEVDDRATPDLMDNFYSGLEHESAAAALRAAKLKMVHSTSVYRFPYYWASLQLYTGS